VYPGSTTTPNSAVSVTGSIERKSRVAADFAVVVDCDVCARRRGIDPGQPRRRLRRQFGDAMERAQAHLLGRQACEAAA
jgi:CO/xanthine dehydrogenase Mo-binding subunit